MFLRDEMSINERNFSAELCALFELVYFLLTSPPRLVNRHWQVALRA